MFLPSNLQFFSAPFLEMSSNITVLILWVPNNMASKTKSSSKSQDLTFLLPLPVSLPCQLPIPCLTLCIMLCNFQLSAFARSSTQFLNSVSLCPQVSYFQPICFLLYKILFSLSRVELAPSLLPSLFPKGTLLIAFMLVVSLLTWVLLILGDNLLGAMAMTYLSLIAL